MVNPRHTYEQKSVINEGLIERILEKEGRKQHKIMNFCYTMMFKKDTNHKMFLSYSDRLLKASKRKIKIIKKLYGDEYPFKLT